MTNNFTENDWRLFKSKIADWQEEYISKLNKEYLDILQCDAPPSEMFWELEKRINADKNKAGVIVEMKRSVLVKNIVLLLEEKAIDYADIAEFSEDLKNTVKILVKEHS
jgi:hypothetical protein